MLDVASESEDLREVVSNYVCDMVRPSRVSYENGSLEDGCFYKTFHIDSRLYLEELKIEAMLRGVRFVQKRFSSLEDIMALSEMAIWNCTNEASAYLFDDSAFQKQHFITLDFEEVPISKEDFAFRGRSDGQEFELQCIGNKQHLILRVDQPNLSKQAIADRLTLVRRAIESRRLQPKL